MWSLHTDTVIVYTYHFNIKSFITTKQLTWSPTWLAETLGCFDFEIKSKTGGKSQIEMHCHNKHTGLLWNRKSLALDNFSGLHKVTLDALIQKSAFPCFFEDKAAHLDGAKYWFEVNILGLMDSMECQILEIWMPMSREEISPKVWTIKENVTFIRPLTGNDKHRGKILLETKHPVSLQKKKALKCFSVKDRIFYNTKNVEGPNYDTLTAQILNIRQDSQLARHQGQARTLFLVRCSFTCWSQTVYVNRYIDGFDLCQQVNLVTQNFFGTLEPLAVPAGPWMDISDDLITGINNKNYFDKLIQKVIRWDLF